MLLAYHKGKKRTGNKTDLSAQSNPINLAHAMPCKLCRRFAQLASSDRLSARRGSPLRETISTAENLQKLADRDKKNQRLIKASPKCEVRSISS